MSARFSEWELLVISALAEESLARMKEREHVRYPERFLEKCERDLQDELRDSKERSSLMHHARRLNVGPGKIRHPPRVDALGIDDHEPAPPEVAEAYMREIMDRLRPSPLAVALERTKGAR